MKTRIKAKEKHQRTPIPQARARSIRERPSVKVTMTRVDELEPYSRNPRSHPPEQIQKLTQSILEFGFRVPILIDTDGEVIAGHGRLEAAKRLGLDTLPTIRCDDLTSGQVKAYRLADNRIAEGAAWDKDVLRVELEDLIEIDFDPELTGFDTAEIDLVLQDSDDSMGDPAADAIPESPPDQPTVSQIGDLWILGDHRLLCGDATSGSAFEALMGKHRADMVITDAPYNVPIQGHASGKGAVQHGEFVMGAGEMSEAEYVAFLGTVFGHLAVFSADGCLQFFFIDWRHLPELYAAAIPHYGRPKNFVVWNKTNAGMGSLYRSQHELIPVFKNGKASHTNNVMLGKSGRYRSNVWTYAGLNAFGSGRADQLEMHPTAKPVGLIADAIRDCTKLGGLVLDCFAGSGTTIIAGEKTQRHVFAMELDPHYVDTAVRRWQRFTGGLATLASSGLSFAAEENPRHG